MVAECLSRVGSKYLAGVVAALTRAAIAAGAIAATVVAASILVEQSGRIFHLAFVAAGIIVAADSLSNAVSNAS
jgi:hypothetical protein